MIYNQMWHRFVIHGLEYIPNYFRPGKEVLESIGKAGNVGFVDSEHEHRFENLLIKTGISAKDCERLPLLYLFTCPCFNETGIELESIFDFETKCLLPDNVRELLEWAPDTQRKMCLAILHLYNDFYPDVDTMELFENLSWDNAATVINALKIRFF